MSIRRCFVRIRQLIITTTCFFLCGISLQAFDTGHHHDLTASALKSQGFGDTPIRIAQLENWLVDYYSNQPAAGLKADLEKLHFDNLVDSGRTSTYWDRLRTNSKAAFESAAADGDSLRVVAFLGMSLHAVQDFYTHSNWVEEHVLPATGFLTDTYFDNPTVAAHLTLRTGRYPNHSPLQPEDHGDGMPNSSGMNHDSYSRARWNQAYVYGFCASRQWIQAARSWVEAVPGGNMVWAKALSLALDNAQMKELAADLNSAYRISEYTPGGHWKGPGSESAIEFAAASAAFVSSSDSIFVKHFKIQKWHRQLTDGLELTTPPMSVPPIPVISHPFAIIGVQTLSVAELPVGVLESKIDPGGDADFYARIQINGQLFTESMQLDSSSVSPAWNSMAFVPVSQAEVTIRYELWDEDGGVGGDDDQCDIYLNTGERGIALKMNLATESLSGDFTGVYNSPASALESVGKTPDKDRAKVRLVFFKSILLP